MDWFRIYVQPSRLPSWLQLPSAVRGDWLALVTVCALEENGGLLAGAATWNRHQWAVVGVTRRQVDAVVNAALASWQGDNLMVSHYPKEDEQRCSQARLAVVSAKSRRKADSGDPSRDTSADRTERREKREDRRSGSVFSSAQAAEGTGEQQQGGQGKKPRAKKPANPPLPFTLKQLVEALVEGSAGRFIAEGFDSRLASPITAVIREAAAAGYTLADARLAGEFIAARWRPGIEVGPGWLAKVGNLLETIGRARRWDQDGRQRAADGTHPGNNRVATAVDQGWRGKVNLGAVELEYLRRGITPEWWADPARAQMTEDADGKPLPSPAQIREMCAKEQQAAKERARA